MSDAPADPALAALRATPGTLCTTLPQLAAAMGRSTFSQPTSPTSGLAAYDLEGAKRPPHPGARPIR